MTENAWFVLGRAANVSFTVRIFNMLLVRHECIYMDVSILRCVCSFISCKRREQEGHDADSRRQDIPECCGLRKNLLF
ncbi:unnamed protein product [Acanthoscelides obtectus]|uniref:Uncharacterized protein n=1 Tax=Acanthoscelides obtectus TaxID=200917 RepID=A0A9P0JKG6_ACAOB|nr:unnamed protein product [Acanthoscelides obtectus]CAK1661104.1 hypothetical protein AOBTE_LOCUS22440 [Acanthoscelides obtectus]